VSGTGETDASVKTWLVDTGPVVAYLEKYSDTPMDYADATLVLLAEALEVHEVLTLDRRGFST
jgi:predicted nucleic acid-binding protein